MKIDLGPRPYKKIIEPSLSAKEDIMKILLSDNKSFDIDAVYSSQNDRVWAVDCADADEKGGIQRKQKFPQKVMVWLGACFQGVTPLVILHSKRNRFFPEPLKKVL